MPLAMPLPLQLEARAMNGAPSSSPKAQSGKGGPSILKSLPVPIPIKRALEILPAEVPKMAESEGVPVQQLNTGLPMTRRGDLDNSMSAEVATDTSDNVDTSLHKRVRRFGVLREVKDLIVGPGHVL